MSRPRLPADRGKIPGLEDGGILGHEFMGLVEEARPDVTATKRCDRVVIPLVIACGQRFSCAHERHAACETTNDVPGPTLLQCKHTTYPPRRSA